MLPMYKDAPRLAKDPKHSVAADLFAHGLSLPCSVGLTVEEQERVIQIVCNSHQEKKS
jgi:dTDP-4-amino-4,6-dideoxygalactose transaminase